MVVLMVVLTICLFLVVDFFVQRRRQEGFAAQPDHRPFPLSATLRMMPAGIFLQRSFTWSRILDDGNVVVGVQPFLMGLVGQPDRVEILPSGVDVKKGDVIATLHKGAHTLHVRSPLDGMVNAINEEILEQATWNQLSQEWLLHFRPAHIGEEVPSWLIAEEATTWMRDQYRVVREYFTTQLPGAELGVTMADGGDIPVGILDAFEEDVWKQFEADFCTPNNN